MSSFRQRTHLKLSLELSLTPMIRKRGLIGRCVQCKTLQHSPFLIKNTEGTKFTFNRTLVNPLCLCCGARVEQCGPMWIGEIHDTEFVRKVLADARSDASVHIGTKDRIDGLLSVISEVRALYYKFTNSRS